jgi:two-component system, cell cycle sensor histidine kinase and response regulator CckA
MSTDSLQGRTTQAVAESASEGQVERLKEAIVRSQHNYRELIDNLDQALFTISCEGVVRVANLRLSEFLGASFQELIGRPLSDFIESPTLADAQKALSAFLKAGVWSGTIPVRLKKDKAPLYFECWLQTAVDGEDKSIIGWARDVTQRHEMERKLRHEQQFVKSLIECFPDLIMVLNKEGRFEFVSDHIKDIVGLSPADYIGQPAGQRIEPEDIEKLRAMFRTALTGQKNIEQIEIHVRHINGTVKTVRVTANALYDEKGDIVGMVSSGRDVTESKQLEQELADKEKFASMGQMMAGAAHELNNPLTAILGVSDLLRERASDDATRRQVDLVLQQARRAAAIVQNLLAFSRPLARGRTKVRLEEILKEALQAEHANFEKKNISVKLSLAADLPPVDGDRKLLSQVFLNIVTNAEQAISPAHEQGALDISATFAGEKISVTFVDDGPGIAPEIIGKVFDPFFTTKRPGGGSGLGLTICLAVVKEHGGTIEIESQPGAGATIRVLLPAAAESETSDTVQAPAATSEMRSVGNAALRGHSVLIVDDEEGIREIVHDGLEARGMKVEVADSSEAALAYLEKNRCEIIVCDFNLPGMSGGKLFEELGRRLGGALPRFVFMTGELVDSALSDRYRGMGARVLQKPFQISALAALLAELIQEHPVHSK